MPHKLIGVTHNFEQILRTLAFYGLDCKPVLFNTKWKYIKINSKYDVFHFDDAKRKHSKMVFFWGWIGQPTLNVGKYIFKSKV
jgi:hypothetical protein